MDYAGTAGDNDTYALTRGVVTGFDYNATDIEGTLVGFTAAKSTTAGYTDDYVALRLHSL